MHLGGRFFGCYIQYATIPKQIEYGVCKEYVRVPSEIMLSTLGWL